MNLFDDADGSRIVINEKSLQMDYSPPQILNRDKEINTIASSLKTFLRSKTPQHLFVYGIPGTGKTTCANHVTTQLEEYTNAILPIYINCWQFSTSLSIYSEIAVRLRLPLPRRGLSKDEVASRVLEILKKDKMRILLILDELDGLVSQGMDFLYFASRCPHLCVLGISNKMNFLAQLDQRIRSSFQFQTLEFKKYSFLELKDILTERAKNALVAGSWNSSLMEAIAKKSADTGDARFAIGLLLKSAQAAQKRNSNKVEITDVPNQLYEYKWHGLGLSENELLVLNFLKEGEKTSTEVYDHFYSKKIELSKRRIRVYLDSLIEKQLISQKEINTGSFLKPRMFRLV